MKKSEILELAVELLEEGEDSLGICIKCGEIADGVEPDATRYECESCNNPSVYGLENICLMFGGI